MKITGRYSKSATYSNKSSGERQFPRVKVRPYPQYIPQLKIPFAVPRIEDLNISGIIDPAAGRIAASLQK